MNKILLQDIEKKHFKENLKIKITGETFETKREDLTSDKLKEVEKLRDILINLYY